jgi:hypothetical protein
VEVALLHEGHDIDNELVFVQDGIYDDRDHACEEVATENLHNDDDKATCLENGAADGQ